MGRSLGDLFWRITGDTSQFDKSVNDTRKEAQNLDKTATKSFGSIKLSSIAMGVATSAVFIKTIGFLKDSAVAAINAQETFSKFDVVFSQMGSAAESAAMQFKDSFDLAEVTAKKMISDTGNILVGFGATQKQSLDLSIAVNSLASDLASFTNYTGGAEGASQALTRAMLGERESLKLLGIVIREEDINVKLAAKGQKDLTGNALNLAKAQATLEIAMEQGKNAIGDYARTHDSASNTLKRAKEATTELQVAIGTALSPSVTLLGSLWGTVAARLAEVIAQRNRLIEAEEKAGTVEDTTALKIERLQEERKQLQANINLERVYDAEGKQVRTRALEDAEKALKANEDQLRGLQLRLQYEKQASDQQAEAQSKIASWNEANVKADTDELNRKKSIAEEKKAINDEYLAQTEELNWKVSEGIITEIEERDALKAATENQIQSLYDLYVQTGDQSILTSEAMQNAILKVGLLEKATGDATDKMQLNFQEVSTIGVKSLLSGMEDVGETLVNGGSLWDSFAKAALNSIASMLEAMAAQLAAQAAWSIANAWNTVGVSLSGAGPAAAGAAAAYAAAGAIRAVAANFETGGIVEPTSSGAIVRVAENGAGEVLFNTGESGQAFIDQMGSAIAQRLSVPVVLEIDGEKLAAVVVKPINNGRVRLNV